MTTIRRRPRRAALALALAGTLAGSLAGCDGYLRTVDPSVVDAAALDPMADVEMLSMSARQNLAAAYAPLIVHSAWFAGEALVGDPGAEPNAFGRRDLSPANQTLTARFRELAAARALAAETHRLAARGPAMGSELPLARAALVAGYAFVLLAEQFCQGAVDGGPPLTTAMTLDSAVAWFDRAVELGGVVTASAAQAEARQIVNAALVGRARAQLQAGRLAQAAGDAGRVDAGFDYRLLYSDDAANRGRVGNMVWDLTFRRRVLVVAPAFRGLGDPRVPVTPPSTPPRAADGVTDWWAQAKYTSYAAPIRLASRLEAEYILAEATGRDAMLALIQARRAANGQPAFSGPTDEASVLTEFLTQRAREFFLEGKTLGDFRRHPEATAYTPAPGTPFHKSGYGPVADQRCYPVPERETQNNPNFPG